ncbi:DUF1566 domain-containing protein [Pendulispora albinea]|uniref:DUF1566 domain-containing protein n=1 Tax=Pendulispora albinea TaxID=2741071 RepID=A0ABZ2M7E3_9BACT
MRLVFVALVAGSGAIGCRSILGIDDDATLFSTLDGGGDLPPRDGGRPDAGRDPVPDGGSTDASKEHDGALPGDGVDRTEPQWPLPVESPPLSNYDVTEETVLDKTTGLMWQRRMTIEDVWAEASGACAKLALAGYRDWRLATRIEMISLLDYGPNAEYMNPNIFSQRTNISPQWTASKYVVQPTSDARWVVRVLDAVVAHWDEASSEKFPVRCVRGGKTSSSPRFVPSGTTVLDARTGLSWEKGTSEPLDFTSARQRCEALEPAGFRLPNVRELQTLIDETRTEAPTWNGVFDKPAAGTALGVWSSTVRTRTRTGTLVVDFATGGTKLNESADTRMRARCVR